MSSIGREELAGSILSASEKRASALEILDRLKVFSQRSSAETTLKRLSMISVLLLQVIVWL